jgi:hypothetical protein
VTWEPLIGSFRPVSTISSTMRARRKREMEGGARDIEDPVDNDAASLLMHG